MARKRKTTTRRPAPRGKSRGGRGWRSVGTHPILLALAVVAALFGLGITAHHFLDRPKPPLLVAQGPGSQGAGVLGPVAQVPVTPLAPPPPPAAVAEPAEPPPLGVTEPEPGTDPDAAPSPPVTLPPTAGPLLFNPLGSTPPRPDKPAETALLPPPASAPPRDGTPPWKRYAVPTRVTPDRPAIAIVIDDMGLDRKRSARTVKLPGPLTLAWLPYANELPAQTQAARAAGHELMLHLPMEPSVKADPGPGALLTGLPAEEIRRRLTTALNSFDGYVGVNNHMGSRFTADRALMAPVLAEVQRRGLLWLDSRTTPHSVAAGLALPIHLPFAGRDVFLDNVETVAAVRGQLARVEAVARQQGVAIAIGHPHDSTIEALSAWLPDVQKRGFALVTISAAVRARGVGG